MTFILYTTSALLACKDKQVNNCDISMTINILIFLFKINVINLFHLFTTLIFITIFFFQPQADHFVKKGLITVRVDYRVQGRHKVPPFVCLSDAKSAIRYIRKNADSLCVKSDSIVASGGSAGGHLAVAIA